MKTDIVRYHKEVNDEESGEKKEINFEDLDQKYKIRVGVKRRLQEMIPYIDKWP